MTDGCARSRTTSPPGGRSWRWRKRPPASSPAELPVSRVAGWADSSLGEPIGVEDPVDAAHGLQHRAEVLGVGHLEGELALRDPVATRGQTGRQDVDVL